MKNKPIQMPVAGEHPSVVVLADGSYPSGRIAAAMLAASEKVVCCDAAAVAYSGRGGKPYAMVGDCDSLPPDFLAGFEGKVVRDGDQECNDLTKAVRFCLSEGLGEVVILGATGLREDHTMANIGLLVEYVAMKGLRSVRMISDYGVFDPVLPGRTFFECVPGQQISVFSPDMRCRVTTGELRYPLCDEPLGGLWRGTLNEALGSEFSITVSAPAIIFRLFPEVKK